MCIIDMTGVNNKPKKLLLNISKADFIDKMIFDSDNQKERCKLYLDLKGVSYHVVLANYIGLDANGKVEYKKVQNLYVYDKRVRYILYKFISALEEGIRGYISNKYFSKEAIKRISVPIFNKIREGSSISKELENLDFNKLIQLSLKLKSNESKELFNYNESINKNLDAVRVLRNTVSHHRMLFVFEDYEACSINGVERTTLKDNIINLSNLINPFYKEFLINAINNAAYDDEDENFYHSLPKHAVLKI